LSETGKRRFVQDCVVEDAVQYEPVSTEPNSLITRKMQGISHVLTLRLQFQHIIGEHPQRLAARTGEVDGDVFEAAAGPPRRDLLFLAQMAKLSPIWLADAFADPELAR
jgi:hypothetical protein